MASYPSILDQPLLGHNYTRVSYIQDISVVGGGGWGRSSLGTATVSCMSMNVGGLGACCPRKFSLDLRYNLRSGSDYFEKSSNSVIDIILIDGP